ncbi:ParB/RepB/Spo0J family partition protein [Spiroplasma endosymbiont of Labia minor]|uniref:ParB/RepB/Spo0J family partition protein n=1 Tax=Spiroplasma endosymbiont of Labia minor TaxID=3066305 RepID=UPI0030CA7212
MANSKKTKYEFKGLDKIFGDSLEETLSIIDSKIPQEQIKNATYTVNIDFLKPNPYQPRRKFAEEDLKELSDSIKINGIIQPIIVTENEDGTYTIIAGERRTRAAKIAKLIEIPVLILKLTQNQMREYAIIENVQRVDLSDIEEAIAYKSLAEDLGLTQEEIGIRVGKSRSHVANIMRLLNLPEEIKDGMLNGLITMGQAKPLLTITSDKKLLNTIFEKIIKENLTSREIEYLVKQKNKISNKQHENNKPIKSSALDSVQNHMIRKLGTKISIDDKTIKIYYSDTKDLNRILEILDLLEN